jgi:F-type H+-transporting ATPase subunit c
MFTTSVITKFTINSRDFPRRNKMEEAARYIGAGLAGTALIGAGIGIGSIFSKYLEGALRNPSAAASQQTNLLLGFALCEATGLFGFVLAMIILFV